MKKSNSIKLTSFGILVLSASMVLAGCGGGNSSSAPTSSAGSSEVESSSELSSSEVIQHLDAPKTVVTLSEDFVKTAFDTTYFAPHLVSEGGAQPVYQSIKDDALLVSGATTHLYAYGLPDGFGTGVTIFDADGKETDKIQVGADGTLTMPTVTQREDFKLVFFGTSDDKTVKKVMNIAVVPVSQVNNSSDGWIDLRGLNGDEREKAAGSLERFMLEEGLAPIGTRDSGGYVLYSSRVHSAFLDANKYIPGFGYGVLTYGTIDSPLAAEATDAFKMYFHDQEAAENDIGDFNPMNSQSAEYQDFYDNTAIGFWSKYVNEDLTGSRYEGVACRDDAPIAINPDENGASDTWKVRLRVGGDVADPDKGVTPGFNYRTASTDTAIKEFNNRPVKLDDYLTGFKLLCNGGLDWYRGNEMAQEETENRQIAGFAEHFEETDGVTALDSSADIQEAIGVTLDESDNSITIKYNAKITPDYAEYQIDGYYSNPIPMEFLEALGGGDSFEGAQLYGKTNSSTTLTPLDTLLSVGPYYFSYYENKKTSAFAKNESWPLCKDNAGRDLFQIAGVHLNMNSAVMTDPEAYINAYEAGLSDYSNIPTTVWDKYAADPCKHPVDGSNITAFSWKVNFMDAATYDVLFPEGTWEVEPASGNDNFYKGLCLSIDRIRYANEFHSNPRYEMAEPITMVSPKADHVYLASDPHYEAVDKVFGRELIEDYANWKENGAFFFEQAIAEELAAGHYELGTADEPTTITLRFIAGECTDLSKQQNKIVTDSWSEGFELAVRSHTNDAGEFEWCDAENHPLIKFAVDINYVDYADGTDYQNKLIWKGVKLGLYEGQLDFYISGNAYDVLNAFDKYMPTDNFALNFACVTDIISPFIEYNGKYWSFDDLWNVFNNSGSFFGDDGYTTPAYQIAAFDFAGKEGEEQETIIVTLKLDLVPSVLDVTLYADYAGTPGDITTEDYFEVEDFTQLDDGTYVFELPVASLVDMEDVYAFYAAYVDPSYQEYADMYKDLGVKWFEIMPVLTVDIGGGQTSEVSVTDIGFDIIWNSDTNAWEITDL